MITKDALHRFVDELTTDDVEELVAMLQSRGVFQLPSRSPRPLTREDIILAEPLMPDDETADELIETVRRWRREGGYA